MTTKTITIKATDVALDLINKRDTGAPHGWVSSVLSKVLARVPQAEQDSLTVHGLDDLAFTYTHHLTETEQLAEKVSAMEQKAQAIARLLPRVGEGMTADEVAELRGLLGV